MKSIMRSLLVIILLFFSGNLISQDAVTEIDRVYGLDGLLYNGKKYTYFVPTGTGGNQFLISPDYFSGEATIKGKSFEGVDLNYDIFNQQLLLQYANETGALNIIEVSKAWLEGFKIGNLEFKYLSFDNSSRFYQVLGDGPLFILHYWRKDLNLDASYRTAHYAFTPSMKSQYVLINGKLHSFRNKRSLISLFSPENKQNIRDFMHRNRIKIKKASNQAMIELINYIGNL